VYLNFPNKYIFPHSFREHFLRIKQIAVALLAPFFKRLNARYTSDHCTRAALARVLLTLRKYQNLSVAFPDITLQLYSCVRDKLIGQRALIAERRFGSKERRG